MIVRHNVCGGPGAGAGGVSRYPKLLFNIRSMVRRVPSEYFAETELISFGIPTYEAEAARPRLELGCSFLPSLKALR